MMETIPVSDRVSRGFFAALLAAVEGNDEEAAEILREVARELKRGFATASKGKLTPKAKVR